MKKVVMNFFMDTILILVLMSQVFTGILLHRFPPELAYTTVLGLTRYNWGTIHWTVSILFALVVIIHLILHWGWVKTTTLKYISMHSKVLLALTVIVFLFTFLMPYYVTNSLTKRSDYRTIYQENNYEKSKLIQEGK